MKCIHFLKLTYLNKQDFKTLKLAVEMVLWLRVHADFVEKVSGSSIHMVTHSYL